jgi:hypothetical protein
MDKATNSSRKADVDGVCNDAETDSTVSANKRAKMTNLLTLLDENSLLQVLLRTHCEDHNALRHISYMSPLSSHY